MHYFTEFFAAVAAQIKTNTAILNILNISWRVAALYTPADARGKYNELFRTHLVYLSFSILKNFSETSCFISEADGVGWITYDNLKRKQLSVVPWSYTTKDLTTETFISREACENRLFQFFFQWGNYQKKLANMKFEQKQCIFNLKRVIATMI